MHREKMQRPDYEPRLCDIDSTARWFGIPKQRVANYGRRYPDVKHGENQYDLLAVAMHLVRTKTRRRVEVVRQSHFVYDVADGQTVSTTR